jgi:hypothetical protein
VPVDVPADDVPVDDVAAVPVVVFADAVSATPAITVAVNAAPTAATTPLASRARRRSRPARVIAVCVGARPERGDEER